MAGDLYGDRRYVVLLDFILTRNRIGHFSEITSVNMTINKLNLRTTATWGFSNYDGISTERGEKRIIILRSDNFSSRW